jgi:hypothetical protein
MRTKYVSFICLALLLVAGEIRAQEPKETIRID